MVALQLNRCVVDIGPALLGKHQGAADADVPEPQCVAEFVRDQGIEVAAVLIAVQPDVPGSSPDQRSPADGSWS